ncbi:hypothetical protein ACICHK_05420 [Streptomyces sp. AHU1]|uniref:hypothetical protein n=1 Tax=Streptomyces sp. AHU1 TaxID=3377215 RepID=UPI003877BC71
MTADVGTRNTSRPETGWAKARRPGRTGPRTCLPATAGETARQERNTPEGNIIRGED